MFGLPGKKWKKAVDDGTRPIRLVEVAEGIYHIVYADDPLPAPLPVPPEADD